MSEEGREILTNMSELCDVFLNILGFNDQSLDDDESMDCPDKRVIDLCREIIVIKTRINYQMLRYQQ